MEKVSRETFDLSATRELSMKMLRAWRCAEAPEETQRLLSFQYPELHQLDPQKPQEEEKYENTITQQGMF